MFVVIRLKGEINLRKEISDTLKYMGLYRKFSCTILPPKRECLGMIKKVERYVTWGEINKEVLAELIRKRGRLPGNKRLTEEYVTEKTGKNFDGIADEILTSNEFKIIPGMKKFFRLKPPTKGLESIKKPYSLGGSFGYRKEKINDLIKRMI